MVKRLSMVLAGLFLCLGVALAQSEISGTVVSSENGEPVVGASITEIGSTRGTISDNKGAFQLNVDGSAKLKISFLGYKTIEQRAKSNMNVKLVPDNALLDEVVVVGYGQH